ncbi:Lrp/AsnC family transcriptional regulator [Candidatus Methanodesulfokora washburnensis]|jgi:Lrp/AsnC family transcriptional regulator for asnA, asnC and gidA|uniref:Lrp/AsnC family transcriptional regulator n=1 Tax=Candidatus Methanodesulfokora washburnensis TaxID=2478471 RepID=A0A429GK40_9CREN|nr:Lrp/AsnC family transcriptional regulator [Candidatus Methanodesulfokores washburnensis]RSN74202.1 Lrp/AsnC family transcriptional regulator [Candidatus Methanodesulfokores washburnensis]
MRKDRFIDEKDMEILKMLKKDARIPLTEISRIVGISDVAVKKRISKLEKRGVIRGYTALIDPSLLGYNSVSLTGIDTMPESIFKVIDILKKKDYINTIYVTTGDHMIIVEIWAKDNQEMSDILKEIESIEGVKRVCPAIVLDVVRK